MTSPEVIPQLPCSKKQLGKLGERLVAGTATGADLDLFAAAMEAYDHRRSVLQAALGATDWTSGDLGETPPSLSVSGRTKTLGTLVEKLQRTPAVKLAAVQDVAGVRIVADETLTLSGQDRLAKGVAVAFRVLDAQLRYGNDFNPDDIDLSDLPEPVDRRKSPRAGYRALHVVGRVADVPVEVQIRTALQAQWADLYERFCDRYGRDLRYLTRGELVQQASRNGRETGRARVALSLQGLSLQEVARVERLHDQSEARRRLAATQSGTTQRRMLARIEDAERIAETAQESLTRQFSVLRKLLTGDPYGVVMAGGAGER